MKKLGLVLDGGGGRGAYQLGIWKYIKEIGLDKHIKVISGCSVGSLNACLLAMDNYDMAYSIWTNEVKDKIICADVDSIKNHILDYTSGNITDTIIKFKDLSFLIFINYIVNTIFTIILSSFKFNTINKSIKLISMT